MRPAPVSILALLLVASVALPAGSTVSTPVGDQPAVAQFDEPSVIAPIDNFANRASISGENVTTSSYDGVSVDVAIAVEADAASLRSTYHTTAFEDQFYGTQQSSERDEIITTHIRWAEARTTELRDRREAAIDGFATGDHSTRSLVRSLALIDSEAGRVAATVRQIKNIARTSSYSLPRSLDTRLENLRGELEVLEGPVAQRAARAVRGDEAIESVYVETSNSGYTLAMIDGDTYFDERQPSAVDQFRESDLYLLNAANRRWVELYPWIANDTSPSSQTLGETGIYRFRAEYTSGDLTAYLDGGTTNVFRESQRQSVAAVPVTDTVTEQNGSVALQVNLTYQTGPMNVAVVDNDTGEPLDATVSLSGERMGRTGADGTLWLVEPRPGVPLTVRTDGGLVEVRLPP